ncbi:pimeloyl-ACP methyl ester carboxylesterase [Povalibacter uvarum]|uniref:Pimeloyl-ACP methyl ester carboxylesterase n=1 Tax=Povalibacter uvarum TaxID=732238 RepID=A0A841HGF8_9GAMM|nr:alpha/beta hydrolase [Povalibacter uvarum]MBB6092201.1 pimeloyl-ACP methyl ester carboxylesterase [Povalibacter uvarum]
MKWLASLCVLILCAVAHSTSSASDAASASTEYVSVKGVRIAYRSIGDGAPLLLATRLRGTIDTWDPLFLDLLARKHRVITFDYPGIGYSEGSMPDDLGAVASTVASLAAELKLKSFTIVGWSWGGLVAQTLAVEHPQLIDAVILIATNPPGEVPYPASKAFLDRAMKPVNDLADEEVLFFEPADADSRAAAKRSHERIHARSGVTEHIPSRMEQFQPYFVAAQSFRADKADLRGRFSSSSVPKLLITGDNDTSTPGQNWFPLMRQLRNVQLIMYSQTGHAPQHQHPERSVSHIETFLLQKHSK